MPIFQSSYIGLIQYRRNPLSNIQYLSFKYSCSCSFSCCMNIEMGMGLGMEMDMDMDTVTDMKKDMG
jgi:hypothetical protein